MIRRLIALATATLCALTLTMAVSAQTPPPGK